MTLLCTYIYRDMYANKGNNHEYSVTLRLSHGKIAKTPNNKPHTAGGDYGKRQIKSAKATVCKGTDLEAYLADDRAETYVYCTNPDETGHCIAYEFTKPEYIEFVKLWGKVSRASSKNGGGLTIRLPAESKKLRAWLASQAL